MFTGLIADVGRVSGLRSDDAGATIEVSTGLAGELREGDSVAVDGVCLTATAVSGEGFRAQAMHETLRRSTLGVLAPGDPINLELALRADGRLGGHVVQGHVDCVGTVRDVRDDGFSRVLAIEPRDPALARLLVEKGSIAVDGVSLTVSALCDADFEVSLIPETLQRTTLGRVGVGGAVNLEADILAKHVQRLLEAPS
jgi:riboflavin synthase